MSSETQPQGQAGPSICVAMCTYDGAIWLPEQLASIAAQTRRPDRMVAVDDCSSDGTLGILQQFAQTAGFPVEVFSNESNLGYAKNFARAISLSRGDIIVLSDQDDVWMPQKLAALEAAFGAQPPADAVFSDALLVDQRRQPYSYSLWQYLGFSSLDRQRFEAGDAYPVLLKRSAVTGATLAFRGTWKARLLPIPEAWHHDEWIALVIAATGRITALPQQLIEYRQHSANQIGATRRGWGERLRRLVRPGGQAMTELQKARALRQYLAGSPAMPLQRIAVLDRKIEHLAVRAALPKRRLFRVPAIVHELLAGRYRRYSWGWKRALLDFFESPRC